MAPELVTIPCLSDNYAFLLHDPESGATALIDVPEAAPVLAELERRGWSLSDVWITHHHSDHVQGLPDILVAHDVKVTGAAADKRRLPDLDVAVSDGDSFEFAGHTVHVLDVSGHTVGHIAYHVPDATAVFTADSLMALGCGRLFEGSAAQMWASLSRLMTLPADTLVCSGHEYTAANAKFALTIDPDNKDLISRSERITEARAKGVPTVPSTLALELETNPFLRAADPDIRAALGMTDADDVDVFAEIRARKDVF
ncbi:hydroxyacylglutathione hydrolase [Roseobacter ponti]|uniref:Hydroxyacylglutathione hydrolase n=1 Tax=Roseobacter ponti TaxID=1891787 RepID=A0A858SXS0_9RHOB|nr:hydroxyacylglutathione hydrolase [Roseobacter ponti]QJF52261.1 hydroxyacylglutathione hydrolase [Roseobacter ponti]